MTHRLDNSKSTENERHAGSNNDTGLAPDISIKNRFLDARTLASFIVAIGFLIFIFTRLNINLNDVWRIIRSSSPIFYLLGFLFYYASFPIRGWRWKLLLQNAGVFDYLPIKTPSSVSLGRTILLSWFVNCILYARVGDVYRAYLLKEDLKVSFSRSFGTVLAERVIDMAIVFLMLVIASFYFLGKSTGASINIIIAAGFGMTALMIIIVLAIWRFGSRLIKYFPRRFHPYYSLFQQGTLGSFRQLPEIIFLSVLAWLLEAGRLYFISYSLGISLAPMFILFIALTHALITALPITPGGLGIAEGGIAGLLMLVLARNEAWSLTLLDRSITYLSIITLGLVFFILRQISLRNSH